MIRRLVVWWAYNTIVLGIAVLVLGSVTVSGSGALALAGLVLAILNVFLKPILRVFGIALSVFTLGLSLLLVNVIIIALTGWLVSGLDLGGFVSTVEVAIVMWLASLVLQLVFRRSD